MDEAFDPRDERNARRFRIGVRLVLYPILIGLIPLAWHHYRGGEPAAEPIHVEEWSGVTSQGRAMRATTGKGLLRFFDTELDERCSDGSMFVFHWTPAQYRFVQHGETLQGRSAGESRDNHGRMTRFDNRVWARVDARPHGTIRGTVTWGFPATPVRCDSGAVRFSLHRLGR
jgi:hypothetical protein